ncbi:class I SAM-dependent methyltransferase [Natronospirillum operosum]|uniref:Class I SAM-dependent methyltransferase n=1 Tax=Natronospirillum operosum TaxID=2759953 RepID=A0A4Z0W227_9GAMM|nr:class I SAM-dependent methyltransferase [Natronospirillum operosum]TGG90719.1 class I SAM-dependent methyltransferase [Natronospirillum operosum]
MAKIHRKTAATSQSWDGVADWYAGWSGARGSFHHRKVAIPTVMDLLRCRAGESVIDLGCGPGALASAVAQAGARYTGVDLSRKLIRFARKHNQSRQADFQVGDLTDADLARTLGPARFDAAVFLLSLQDIHPMSAAIANAAAILRPGGRLVILMTHPCFRIPRQSGWGWDGGRKLQYRRVDHYLSPLQVPMQPHQGTGGITRSYHWPLSSYVSELSAQGLMIDQLQEIPMTRLPKEQSVSRAEKRALREIPLFLALRAQKLSG